MRLVPTSRPGLNMDHDINGGKLIKLQARFLKCTKTRWICNDSSKLMPQQWLLYNTLWALTLPPSPANQLCKPLFHAISPSISNDRYLVCFLPQYCALAQAAIARLSILPTKTPVSLASPSVTSKDPPTPLSRAASSPTGYMETLDQWIWLQFNTPFLPSSQPISQPTNCSAHPITLRLTPSSSHHKLLPWLVALKQKFQNTAWDRWRYQNGVL